MSALDHLMAAKAARDTVRDQLVKSIRRLPAPLSEELMGLLRADDLATQGLSIALDAFQQIADFNTERTYDLQDAESHSPASAH